MCEKNSSPSDGKPSIETNFVIITSVYSSVCVCFSQCFAVCVLWMWWQSNWKGVWGLSVPRNAGHRHARCDWVHFRLHRRHSLAIWKEMWRPLITSLWRDFIKPSTKVRFTNPMLLLSLSPSLSLFLLSFTFAFSLFPFFHSHVYSQPPPLMSLFDSVSPFCLSRNNLSKSLYFPVSLFLTQERGPFERTSSWTSYEHMQHSQDPIQLDFKMFPGVHHFCQLKTMTWLLHVNVIVVG